MKTKKKHDRTFVRAHYVSHLRDNNHYHSHNLAYIPLQSLKSSKKQTSLNNYTLSVRQWHLTTDSCHLSNRFLSHGYIFDLSVLLKINRIVFFFEKSFWFEVPVFNFEFHLIHVACRISLFHINRLLFILVIRIDINIFSFPCRSAFIDIHFVWQR